MRSIVDSDDDTSENDEREIVYSKSRSDKMLNTDKEVVVLIESNKDKANKTGFRKTTVRTKRSAAKIAEDKQKKVAVAEASCMSDDSDDQFVPVKKTRRSSVKEKTPSKDNEERDNKNDEDEDASFALRIKPTVTSKKFAAAKKAAALPCEF